MSGAVRVHLVVATLKLEPKLAVCMIALFFLSVVVLMLPTLLARPEEPAAGQVTALATSTSPVEVQTREMEGTNALEVWAEGTMDASVQDIQAAILDAEAYPRFMPYVKESRWLGTADGGGKFAYTLIEPPFLTPRDYVARMTIQRTVGAEGNGEFANSWQAVPGVVPDRRGVMRLGRCEGSWRIQPAADGRARVTYRAAVDTWEGVPAFLLDMVNSTVVTETFEALEKEARHRGKQRRAQASANPNPLPASD